MPSNLFGWGSADYQIPEQEVNRTLGMLKAFLGSEPERREFPNPESIALRPPRFDPPTGVSCPITADRMERMLHHYGQSFLDTVSKHRGDFPNPPDFVAYPESEEQVAELMAYATSSGVRLVPFGGGTSVVGGVEADSGSEAVISVDMTRMNRILEIREDSRSARIQAGILGPDLENGLRESGLTLRHFPQSFEFSSLGGWIATHAGGHYSTRYTHIDDFVESVRMVTPSGIMQTPRLPFNGAGPLTDGGSIGSEGIFGIITEAWLSLRKRPVHRAQQSVRFPDFYQGSAAVREIVQSGLTPSACRLIDPLEAFGNGVGDGSSSLLVLGFESADFPVDREMLNALDICSRHRGKADAGKQESGSSRTEGWKSSFIRAPYLRDALAANGLVVETFETATTWDRFHALHQEVTQCLADMLNGRGFVTCRFTHVYPSGPAPYFTVVAVPDDSGQAEFWKKLKHASLEVLLRQGAAITHHHAVGRDHASTFRQQRDELQLQTLRAMKSVMDPAGIMNPGVLIDPA